MCFGVPGRINIPTHTPTGPGKRVVLTTIGTLGDLHPYLAIALGLKARGHETVVATGECYRRKVEALGLGFRPLRPDSAFTADPIVMRRIMDYRRGTFRVLREVLLPAVRQSYEDTLAAATADGGADLLVSHPIAYATRLVAESTGVPWVSTQVTPVGLFSAHDPPALPGAPDLALSLRGLGPAFWWPLGQALVRATRPWGGPIRRLRSELGLPPAWDNPLVEGHSPARVLALFSPLMAAKQPDWPPQTVHTGFPFLDRDGDAGLPPELARFLDDGPPPVVFTLGDSAAAVADGFFGRAAAASTALGRRAVLVVGKGRDARPSSLPAGVIAVDYVPFSELFPRAAAVVHAGGIGTSGLALHSGRPTLVIPFAQDQPDNAARLARLGVSRTAPRHATPARIAAELDHILNDPSYLQRASEVATHIRRENGVQSACDALEEFL